MNNKYMKPEVGLLFQYHLQRKECILRSAKKSEVRKYAHTPTAEKELVLTSKVSKK